ncbi:MAG: AmmeMemoRadiSam system protein B [Thiohalomonadales bacterium]
MIDTRPAAVAGTFYPQDSQELSQLLHSLLQQAEERPVSLAADETLSNAIILPHAGYVYSGPIAATGYQTLRTRAQQIKTVLIMGPAHRVRMRGCAGPSVRWFETPLGKIPIACDLLNGLIEQNLAYQYDEAHAHEHSLEVHLPFLQTLLGNFSLLPLVVGECKADTIAAIISQVWNDDTLIVISTDLSHFLDYDSARQRDQQTSKAIEALNFAAIGPEDACGCVPLAGLLLHAQNQGLHITTLDCRNSGDTAGDKQRVVGYGAYVVSQQSRNNS